MVASTRALQKISKSCILTTENQNKLIRKRKAENERLSGKLIEDHEEVITLHRELKQVREDKFESLGSVVKAAVNSVKSYSQVLTAQVR